MMSHVHILEAWIPHGLLSFNGPALRCRWHRFSAIRATLHRGSKDSTRARLGPNSAPLEPFGNTMKMSNHGDGTKYRTIVFSIECMKFQGHLLWFPLGSRCKNLLASGLQPPKWGETIAKGETLHLSSEQGDASTDSQKCWKHPGTLSTNRYSDQPVVN